MLFAWIGHLKDGADPVPQDINQQVSDFVQQPFINIHSWGPLCDEQGRRTAMLMVFEIEDQEKAEAFVANSPYLQAGLYDEHHLYEYRNEGG